jgi:hypothetical protein
MYDRFVTSVKKYVGFASQAITTPINGSAIPLKGLISLAWVVVCSAYTSGTMTFTVEVSPNGTTGWVALDSKYIINGLDAITSAGDIASIGISGIDLDTYTHARIVTVGTVVLTANCVVLCTEPDRA